MFTKETIFETKMSVVDTSEMTHDVEGAGSVVEQAGCIELTRATDALLDREKIFESIEPNKDTLTFSASTNVETMVLLGLQCGSEGRPSPLETYGQAVRVTEAIPDHIDPEGACYMVMVCGSSVCVAQYESDYSVGKSTTDKPLLA